MSQLVIGILGVVLIIGLGIAATSYFGSSFVKVKSEAKVADYVNQATQLRRAANEYTGNGGALPVNGSVDPVSTLMTNKALRSAPTGAKSAWALNPPSKSLMMRADDAGGDATAVCIAARRKANMPDPGNPKKCDGSTGALAAGDPCCVG